MRVSWLVARVVAALVVPVPSTAAAATVVEVTQELRQGGNNYDDPCFWQDPAMRGRAVACMTSKSDDLVECFELPSGRFLGEAVGFAGAANNCDVDQARDELVTTDNGGDRVLVHGLPRVGSARRVLQDPDFSDVTGLCVGHRGGASLVFVTDESHREVFVLDSATGGRVGRFSHGLSKAEGIECDDRRQRVYVCDDESDAHSCRAFTFDGSPISAEFGIAETGPDSEGVTLYECGPQAGYVIVSDQSNDEFEVFDRQEPFAHRCTFQLRRGSDVTNDTDGIDVAQIPAYPNGIFGACDGCAFDTDQLDLVPWERIAAACGLRVCPLGEASPDAPRCGDGILNATEQCDGAADVTCPGRCRGDCTCADEPEPGSCGDGDVNAAAEECDGADDGACPGRCATDCTCERQGAPGSPLAEVVADASVRRVSASRGYNGSTLEADRRAPRRTFLRIRTGDAGGRAITSALLHLRVSDRSDAKSNHGGQIYRAGCDWDETRISWREQPSIEPEVIDAHPARVTHGEVVTFDLTGQLSENGDDCFALTTPSANGVRYDSRETAAPPEVTVLVGGEGGATCGDGVVEGGEECDGAADAACPGRCRGDCTCPLPIPSGEPTCGDGVVNAAGEECDGAADDACPGRCQGNCRCPVAQGPGPAPPADPDDDTFACLASGADVVLRGTYTEDYYRRDLAPNTVIDARNATFVHCTQPDSRAPCAFNDYPVNLGPTGVRGVCWAGGVVAGENRPDATWDHMHNPNNAGFIFENPDMVVDGVRLDNVGDGIRPRDGADDFVIKDVWLSNVRDDCVENDYMNAGLVDDSLFDGCFVGFSARHSNPAYVGSDNVWTIQHTLVRLQQFPGPPDGGAVGHKGFFKWTDWGDPGSPSPKLALYSNVFMAEHPGEVPGDKMGIPPGKLVDCADNVMVWLGPGDFPAELPACFTVTKSRSVWDNAVADWLRRHPAGR